MMETKALEDGLHSRWASLPPVLLRNIFQRLEESESTWPSRRDVVACAAVCRPWRIICKEVVRSPEISGKLTFPVSLKQPGPKDGTIKCFIQRDKSKSTYYLYVGLSSAVPPVNGKFLLSAKKHRRISCTEYIISMDANNISRSSSSYMGKLKSNFLCSNFIVCDTQPSYSGAAICSAGRKNRRLYNKVPPKLPSGSDNVAQVAYTFNGPTKVERIGTRQIHCIAHSIPSTAVERGSTVPDQPDNIVSRSFEESFNSLSSISSLTDLSMDFDGSCSSYVTKKRTFVLRNKIPMWHPKLQCRYLIFHGRVTVTSVKNFQLLAASQPPAASPTPSQLAPSEHDKVILQFGKVAKDTFTMDYQYPLSAFQAFAICLSSFSISNLLLISEKMGKGEMKDFLRPFSGL